MKQLLLAGTALLAFATSHPAADAAPVVFDFTFTGSLVDFTVPTTDTYQILAFGAQVGSGSTNFWLSSCHWTGGKGAEIGGDFNLIAGEILEIAVGGEGQDNDTGVRVVALGVAGWQVRRWSREHAAGHCWWWRRRCRWW
jgi:hypothetical protein